MSFKKEKMASTLEIDHGPHPYRLLSRYEHRENLVASYENITVMSVHSVSMGECTRINRNPRKFSVKKKHCYSESLIV